MTMRLVRPTTLTLRCPPKAGLEGWQAARSLYLDHASRLPRVKAGVAPQHEGCCGCAIASRVIAR